MLYFWHFHTSEKCYVVSFSARKCPVWPKKWEPFRPSCAIARMQNFYARIAFGMALGVGIGAAMGGLLAGSTAMGIVVGLAAGASLGVALLPH